MNNVVSAPSVPHGQPQQSSNVLVEKANEGESEPLSQDSVKHPWRTKTILALDGGGVKGFISLLLLEALMKKVKALEEEDRECRGSMSPLPQRRRRGDLEPQMFVPSHYFDYIAGTSSGGILAIMLGRLRMSHTECQDSYCNLVGDVFGQPRKVHSRRFPFWHRNKFDHTKLEEALKSVVMRYDHERDRKASFRQPCEAMCRTIVVAIERGPTAEQMYLFRSYTHAKSPTLENLEELEKNPGHENLQQIWQVGRATSAAQFHFDPIKLDQKIPGIGSRELEFVDGGLAAPNPTYDAYITVRQLYNNAPIAYDPNGPRRKNDSDIVETVVSLGTGKVDSQKRKWHVLKGVLNEIDAVVAWATECERTHEKMVQSREDRPYYRFNVKQGLGAMNLDSWEGDNGGTTKNTMREATEGYLGSPEIQSSLMACAKELVDIRRRRAKWHEPHLWEEFCYGVQYRCHISDCPSGRPTYSSAPNFKDHLKSEHPKLISNAGLLRQEFEKGKIYDLYPES